VAEQVIPNYVTLVVYLLLGGPAFSDRRRTRKPKGTPNKTNLSDVMDTTRFVLKPNLKWHKENDTFATYGSPADGSRWSPNKGILRAENHP
jgi:hypothetical protein